MPATLAAVEEFCLKFQNWRTDSCPGLNVFPGELLLREALTNAVVHGSFSDPDKRIFCALRAKPDRLLIAVWDEGGGFDWRHVRDHSSKLSDTSGRGMKIFSCYASAVRFNAKGNVIFLVKRF